MATQIKPIQLDLSGDGTSGVGAIEGVLKFSDLALTEYLFVGESQGLTSNGSDIRSLTEFLGSAGTDYRINYGGAGGAGDFIVSKGSYTSTANEILRIDTLGVMQLTTALGSPPVPYMFFGEGQNNSTIAPDIRFIDDSLITTDDTLCILFDTTNNGTGSFTVGKGATNTLAASKLFEVENDGTLSVDTPNYENLIIDDNDIPNKAYVDAVAGSGGGGGGGAVVNFFEFIYSASDNQTVFCGFDDFGQFMAYDVGTVVVYVNGVRLHPSEFTAINGTDVILTTPAIATDIVTVATAATAANTLDCAEYTYTATAGQTVFGGLDDSGVLLVYEIGCISVFVNGVKLAHTEFTATDTSTVTLLTPALVNDLVVIQANLPSGTSPTFVEFTYTATAGQDIFTAQDDFGLHLQYKVGSVSVFVNGVKQIPAEFTANDGKTVSLTNPANLGDFVVINAISGFSTPIFNFAEFTFTSTDGQTVFSGLDDLGNNLQYQAGSASVYVNGVKIFHDDFVATDGNIVTLNAPTFAGDVVVIVVAVTRTQQTNTGVNNLIINGNMDIWQRGTSFVSIPINTYNADRWIWGSVGSQVVDINRSTLTPDESSQYSLFINVTTPSGAIGAADNSAITQRLEGNVYRSIVGKNATLSFWVRSNKIGTYCVSFRNDGFDRSYVAEYTIDSVDTWEHKSITVPFTETGGTWNYDIGIGLRIGFIMNSGSNFQTTANTWQTGNFDSTINQVNFGDTINNEFRLTKVQLEIGNVANDFEHRTITEETILCQRYFEKTWPLNTDIGTPTSDGIRVGNDDVVAGTNLSSYMHWITPKRVSPSIIIYNLNTGAANSIFNLQGPSSGSYAVSSVTGSEINLKDIIIISPPPDAFQHLWGIHYTADAEL